MYWILFIGVALMGWLVQQNLQNKFTKYKHIPMPNGLTGREVAERMLRENGIYNVRVTSTRGSLTDHYNPATLTVNLSEDVYNERNVAAAAVAAHECGHAIQHAQAYAPLKMRSALVPIVNFASSIMSWVLLAGIVMVESFPELLLIGIILFASTTLFSFITLPVEINASYRATQWLKQANIVTPALYPYAVSALRAAAYTYVVAALSSLATLVYYILIYTRRRD